MRPEVLLAILVHAHRQEAAQLDTLFLLDVTKGAPSRLMHPGLPDGFVQVDAQSHDALTALLQWGYLEQVVQDHGQGYVVTPAGLDYAARLEGSLWDGTERRQQDRRAGRMHPIDDEERRHRQ